MKNTIFNIFFISIVFAMFFISCKKNNAENEPSKEELLCKKWKIEKYNINEVQAEYMTAYSWTFKTDGTLETQEINTQFPEIIDSRTEWRWVDGNAKIEIKAFDKKDDNLIIKNEFILCDIVLLTENILKLQAQTTDISLYIELIKP